MSTIHVLHENEAWVLPLRKAFAARGLAHEEWFLGEGEVDLSSTPPQGVFYNRMSASSHTRGHRFAPEHTAAVLAWLESHGRRVVNSSRALQLEISKVAQYAALARHGIRVPRTVAAVGRESILRAAQSFAGDAGEATPFVLKPNRGGKGLGVVRFDSLGTLAAHLEGPDFEPSPDGLTLVQEYIRAPDASIIRAEFVGGKFLYAVRVDTRQGFELCPADACSAPKTGEACATPESLEKGEDRPMFEILRGFHHPVLEQHRAFLAGSGIHIAGIEFILDGTGTPYTYDINTNTNYNPEAEAAAGVSGMDAIAGYLGRTLARVEREQSRISTKKRPNPASLPLPVPAQEAPGREQSPLWGNPALAKA